MPVGRWAWDSCGYALSSINGLPDARQCCISYGSFWALEYPPRRFPPLDFCFCCIGICSASLWLSGMDALSLQKNITFKQFFWKFDRLFLLEFLQVYFFSSRFAIAYSTRNFFQWLLTISSLMCLIVTWFIVQEIGVLAFVFCVFHISYGIAWPLLARLRSL